MAGQESRWATGDRAHQFLGAVNLTGIGRLGQGVCDPIPNSVLCLMGKARPHQGANFRPHGTAARPPARHFKRSRRPQLSSRGHCSALGDTDQGCLGREAGGNTGLQGLASLLE